jgi:hypothetical protein
MKKTGRKNPLTRKRRKDHFTKKRRKNKSKYNKRSIKRYRKTIKRKYRGGELLIIKVEFEGYSFYTTVEDNLEGFNRENPNGEGHQGVPYPGFVRTQVNDLLLKKKKGDVKSHNIPFYLRPYTEPTGAKERRATAAPLLRSTEIQYDSYYRLVPHSTFLVDLCYSCSSFVTPWDGVASGLSGILLQTPALSGHHVIRERPATVLDYRQKILKNILDKMDLNKKYKEQFRYASEILYYLMNISDKQLRGELIERFKTILGPETFKVIAESRTCLVWSHGRFGDGKYIETNISPKCIIDKRLVDVDDNIVEIFEGMKCKGYRVTVTSEETNDSETGENFTRYTITLHPSISTESTASTDSFNFRWGEWVENKDKVGEKLKESRGGLRLVGYTDEEYFYKPFNKWNKMDTDLIARREQMLTRIFNRLDLGEGGGQTWFLPDDIIPRASDTDPIGTFENEVTTEQDPIKTLFNNIKGFF